MAGVTILGGGPAGLALAFYGARKGISFRLLEKGARTGGMCRTFEFEGHRYDAGAHRFHDKDPQVTADVRKLLPGRLHAVDSPSRICRDGRFLDFPPTPLNLLRSRGLSGMGRIALDVLKARLRPRRPEESFADFARNAFGYTLARSYLMDYSEKVWGLPSRQLSRDISTRRLSGMTLSTLLVELLWPRKKTAHIDGRFLYPKTGFGEIAEALTRVLPDDRLRLNCEVGRLEAEGDSIRALRLAGGRRIEIEGRVVSTLPLTLLARICPGLGEDAVEAARSLRFRSLRLIFLRLKRPRVSENASIYLPEPGLIVSRLYEPKNRSHCMAPAGETGLLAEVPHFRGDATDRLPDPALADRVIREIGSLGLVSASQVASWKHHRLPYAYPVYSVDYRKKVETIERGLGRFENLDLLGRAGRFHYSHLHHQMRFARDYVSGLKAAPPKVELLRRERDGAAEKGAREHAQEQSSGGR